MKQNDAAGRRWLAGQPHVVALVLLVVAISFVLAFTARAEEASESPAGELSLTAALEELRAEGLDLFFTTETVQPQMRVLARPTATDARSRLAQLLGPHGLVAVDGPGGRLVVVRLASSPSILRGTVRVRGTLRPVAGVRVLVPDTGLETLTLEDGSFELSLAGGRHQVEAHLPGFVVAQLEASVSPDRAARLEIELDPAPLALEEIIITPSSISLLRDDPVPGIALDKEDLFELPHLSDDIFRSLTLLPGVTGEEVSARFNVRGGHADEVLVLLDQVELYEPYHLKDYGSSLSIIAPSSLREVNLITGGFPAQYGDRMSGVLDMATVEPSRQRTHIGASLLSLELSNSGALGGDQGHWYVSARRGSLLLALDYLGRSEKPRYWDTMGKIDYQLTERQRLGVNFLHSEDKLDYFNIDPDTTEDYLTRYDNSYLWLPYQGVLGSRFFVEAALYSGRVRRDRRAVEVDNDPEDALEEFNLIDRRRLEVAGLKQAWSFEASPHHYLRWGFEGRLMTTSYDYQNQRELEELLPGLRSVPRTGLTSFERRFESEQYNGYVSDRLRVGDDLVFEVGARYDQITLTRDRHLSPRFNLVYTPSPQTAWRAAWGYFYQSQRPYELQVEDGLTSFASAERTEQRVLGFERTFSSSAKARLEFLRVEAYQRTITNPRPRFENVFEPLTIFPEIEPDRVLIAPDDSEASGFEVFTRGRLGRHDWWASYVYSRVEDRVDGREVPRRIDQPHALTLDLNLRLPWRWNLNLAWRFHTGWPITPILGRLEENDEGELEAVPAFGPRNSDRLPPYHRLDLRASREWNLARSDVGFFIEIQNAYDRENVAGYNIDLEFQISPDGSVDPLLVDEPWGGFLPSFGFTWDF